MEINITYIYTHTLFTYYRILERDREYRVAHRSPGDIVQCVESRRSNGTVSYGVKPWCGPSTVGGCSCRHTDDPTVGRPRPLPPSGWAPGPAETWGHRCPVLQARRQATGPGPASEYRRPDHPDTCPLHVSNKEQIIIGSRMSPYQTSQVIRGGGM